MSHARKGMAVPQHAFTNNVKCSLSSRLSYTSCSSSDEVTKQGECMYMAHSGDLQPMLHRCLLYVPRSKSPNDHQHSATAACCA